MTCGGGTQRRTRTCTPPKYNGNDCVGPNNEIVPCNIDDCPVNGGWGQWGEYGECSQTCKGGFQTRHRLCDNPTTSGGGRYCEGAGYQSRDCGGDQECTGSFHFLHTYMKISLP